MVHEAATSRTASLVPEQRALEPGSTTDPLKAEETAASVEPVPFDRLLSLATLTPAQAVLVAAQLLDAAQARSAADDADPRFRVGAVTFTPSGGIDVSDAQSDQATPVAVLLNRLFQNASRLPAHPRPEQQVLLHGLEESVEDQLLEPGAVARRLDGALAEALGSGAQGRLSVQLAALVEAAAHVARSAPTPIQARSARAPAGPTTGRTEVPSLSSAATGASQPLPRRPVPARRAPSRAPRRREHLPHRMWGRRATLVAAILVAALLGSVYVVLRGPGAGIVGSLGLGREPAAPTTTSPSAPRSQPAKQPRPHRPRAVPALAGRHAGPITAVVLRKAGRCSPGSLCPVTVTVRFRAASTSRTVSWKVGSARLCKPGIVWSQPTTVTARSGWTSVYASSSVRVPAGRRLALFALTTSPGRAQSRPVPVSGFSLVC